MEMTSGFRVAPGCCATCSTSTSKHGVLDLGIENKGAVHFARVYLCGDCAMAAAKLITGHLGKRIVNADIVGELAGLRMELEQSKAKVQEYEGVMRQIRLLDDEDTL